MSEQNKDPIGIWVRGHVCVLPAKNTASPYPYPENLSEAQFKSNTLMCQAEEILRGNFQAMELLLLTNQSHPGLQ